MNTRGVVSKDLINQLFKFIIPFSQSLLLLLLLLFKLCLKIPLFTLYKQSTQQRTHTYVNTHLYRTTMCEVILTCGSSPFSCRKRYWLPYVILIQCSYLFYYSMFWFRIDRYLLPTLCCKYGWQKRNKRTLYWRERDS